MSIVEGEGSRQKSKRRLIALFGSGELSPTGRRIHEYLIKDLTPPVNIALLETPAGYEDNPHQWYQKLEKTLAAGLQNFHPQITRIPALRSDIPGGTNDEVVLTPLLSADYIHSGAGSPSYAVKHLQDSRALKIIQDRSIASGTPLSFASAATIALSTYAIPVYELYFAGHDPHWLPGLNFLSQFGLPPLAIIPHWNNHEGGQGIDTRFSYMGQNRWTKLFNMLPKDVTVWGIDEQTAIILDLDSHQLLVMGKGSLHIIDPGKSERVILSGEIVSVIARE